MSLPPRASTRAISGLAASLALTAAPLAAQVRPVLDPATYRSPSGRWALSVDPTDRGGAGPADVRLERNGVPVWGRQLETTFWEAVVADDGTALGYGYTHGREGREDGELFVAILSPAGELRHLERRTRDAPRPIHGPPQPVAVGVFLQPALGRAVVRLSGEVGCRDGSWWVFDLERAALVRVVGHEDALGVESLRASFAAGVVEGTPLILGHWSVHGEEQDDAFFALLDEELRPVWSLSLPADYDGLPVAESSRLWNRLRAGGGMRGLGPERFVLLHRREGVFVHYAVTPDPDAATGWRVDELRREPAGEQPGEPAPEPEPVELAKLGEIALQVARPEDAGRRLRAWSLAADGTAELLWAVPDVGHRWMRVDGSGAVLVQRDLQLDADGPTRWTALSDGAWLAVAAPREADAIAWRFTPEAGERTRLPDGAIGTVSVESLVPRPEGGFCLLARHRERSSSHHTLTAYDGAGATLWSLRSRSDPDDPGALFSPSEAACDAEGRVAVVDAVRETLQLYDAEGRFERALELAPLFGRERGYPCRVRPAPGGGWLVDDGPRGALWRVELDPPRATPVALREADGGAAQELRRSVRYGPDGRLWAAAGGTLLRFDDEGVEDRRLGEAPGPDALHDPGGFHVDAAGRVLVFDRATGVVHRFERDGSPLPPLVPAPGDYDRAPSTPTVLPLPSGDVLVEAGDSPFQETRFVRYAEDGRRLGLETWPGTGHAFAPLLDGAWAASFDELLLVGPEGAERERVTRRPDRTWIRQVQLVAAARDGSLAVLDTPPAPAGGARTLSTWRPDGTPRGVQPWTGGWSLGMAFVGEWVVLHPEGRLVLLQADGARVLACPHEPRGDLAPSPEGDELWVLDGERRVVERYALPDDV